MKIKYVIHPGKVKSRTDGDYHFISSRRLIELYKINPNECIISNKSLLGREEFIHLYPMDDGRYVLPCSYDKAKGE